MKFVAIKLFWFFARPLQFSYWFIFRPKTKGAKCLVQYQDEFLLIRTTYGRKIWTIPGGGAKRGELLKDTAAREVLEETGVKANNVRKIGDFVTTKQFKHDYVEVYHGLAANKNIEIDPLEIAEAGWFSPSNLPNTHSPRVDQALTMLAAIDT